MPSNARKRFDENVQDIDNLIDVYQGMVELYENDGDPVPDSYDVLFRSAVVLMVSHWEAYVEDIGSEALAHLIKYAKKADKLPKEIKKLVADDVKAAKNEIEVWSLADDGWRQYLTKRLDALKEARDRSFNTPKAQNTADFLRKTLGIADIRSSWGFENTTVEATAQKLDQLIEIRGQIAHRGRLDQRLDGKFVKDHVAFLSKIVSKTGGAISSHVKHVTSKGLWQ